MSDLSTRIQAWLWGRPVHSEATQHAEQIARMFADLGLVVIDPEDREQVERMVALYCDAHGVPSDAPIRETGVDYMQAALRSLITPPKPDEPQGLGAVVEDAKGKRWLRCLSSPPGTAWIVTGDAAWRPTAWDDIAAVRVLSEGWSA